MPPSGPCTGLAGQRRTASPGFSQPASFKDTKCSLRSGRKVVSELHGVKGWRRGVKKDRGSSPGTSRVLALGLEVSTENPTPQDLSRQRWSETKGQVFNLTLAELALTG